MKKRERISRPCCEYRFYLVDCKCKKCGAYEKVYLRAERRGKP